MHFLQRGLCKSGRLDVNRYFIKSYYRVQPSDPDLLMQELNKGVVTIGMCSIYARACVYMYVLLLQKFYLGKRLN